MRSSKSQLLQVPQIRDLSVLRWFLIDEINVEADRKPLNKVCANLSVNVVQLTTQQLIAYRHGQIDKVPSALKKRTYSSYLTLAQLEELQDPANQREFARRWCQDVSPLVEGDSIFSLDERAGVTVNPDGNKPLVYSQINAAEHALIQNMGSKENICILPIDQADNLIHELMSDDPGAPEIYGYERTKGQGFVLGSILFVPVSNDLFPLSPPTVPGVRHVNRVIMFNKNAVLYSVSNEFELDIRINILVDETGIRAEAKVDTAWYDGLTVIHPHGVVVIEVAPV